MNCIHNPILPGFNPDPSIIRVEDNYYIATSTFEWFPGVQIHHSVDLANWRVITHPLNRISQLDMRGVPDSCGVWAPCLSFDGDQFYLVYSNVKTFDGPFKDTPNYLVTSKEIAGPWSDPIFLNASGFDGSLFHNEDGKKWYVSMLVDHRKGKFFGGIILQEYSQVERRLTGPVYHIFEGTALGKTEGPHLYRKDGYYYLITAEGGTEYGHAVTFARSKEITGPYEVHPHNPILTAAGAPHHPLQKTGHGDLVETKTGAWYLSFLTARPLTPLGRCTLGRETAIEEIVWGADGWPYLKTGTVLPRLEINSTSNPIDQKVVEYEDFDNAIFPLSFQSLREPVGEDWCSLTANPGFLRLYGRNSLSSTMSQSLVARRVQHFNISFSTCVSFYPQSFQQLAGLVCYYNTGHYFYLHLAGGKEEQRFLNVYTCDNFNHHELEAPLEIPSSGPIYLKAVLQYASLQFYFATVAGEWQKVGPVYDGSILSDDYVRDGSEQYRPAFTGAFVGICCQDLTGQGLHADFDWLKYVGE